VALEFVKHSRGFAQGEAARFDVANRVIDLTWWRSKTA
jgi:hypothetical protein